MIQILGHWFEQSPGLFLILSIAYSGVFVFAGFHLWKWFHILRTPTTPIADLSDGKVEIKGRIKAIETIPNLSRPAVYYKSINEVHKRDRSKRINDTVKSTRETLFPFEVDDGTGTVAVHDENASVDIAQDRITGITFGDAGHDRSRHFYLEEGSPVYVIGWLGQFAGKRCIGKKRGSPFIISDHKESALLFKHAGLGLGPLAVLIVLTLIFF